MGPSLSSIQLGVFKLVLLLGVVGAGLHQLGVAASAGDVFSADANTAASNLVNNGAAVDSHDEAVLLALRTVSDHLERFNSLYLGKLEARIVNVATLLANIDSNVKNLQERAHVWDTFQLHVSAWNEQSKALDRKVDLLSRGQEALPVLDGKLTQLQASEALLMRLGGRFNDVDLKLASMSKQIEDLQASAGEPAAASSAPLLGEFATRGVLATLKGVERKVDRLSAHLRSEERAGLHGGEHNHGGRLVVRCQAPPTLEAIMHDVAAKVDVLFDRLPEEGEGELRSGESAIANRVFRRLASPLRRTWKALEGVERVVRAGEDNTASLMDGQRELLTLANRTLAHALQGSECCLAGRDAERAWRSETKTLMREFRTSLLNASRDREQIAISLEEILDFGNSSCAFSSKEDTDSDESKEEDSLESSSESVESEEEEESEESTAAPVFLCHQLPSRSPSGVVDLLGAPVKDGESTEVGGERRFLLCDQTTAGGGWTVVQQRGDYGAPTENFTRDWEDYKNGFGDLRREFWAGLDFFHRATHSGRPLRLRVELKDFEGNSSYAEYGVFWVAGESDEFQLGVSNYSGNASDSLGSHNGTFFSTVDRDNDEAPECCPCAPAYGGGWWFYSCFESNLNGVWHEAGEDNGHYRGIIWEHWRGDYSLAATRLMVRPADFSVHR